MTNPEPDGANSYDVLPYPIDAYPQTRPDRLGAIAALFGLEAPPPRQCRVLELGCASGGNLIPLAVTSPRSTFVGIDLSGRQIADGQRVIGELCLANVELKQSSILDVGADFGTFDYLIDGVYSWVPPEVQDKLLDICKRNLAANGIAYVSYNTLPGWHARGAIREMLWYHTERFIDPAERIREARNLLQFLVASVSPGEGGYGAVLREELNCLAETSDGYLMHEHLEDVNDPVYFHEFAERAAAKGLQYLGEAQVGVMVAGRFGADIAKTLRRISPDLLHMEQYMDFLRNRMFRQTLLCHDHMKLDYALRPAAVQSFFIAAGIKPVSANPDVRSQNAESFQGEGEKKVVTPDPLLKAALVHLSKMWPLPVSFADLLAAAGAQLGAPPAARDAEILAARLVTAYAGDVLEFSSAEPAFRIAVSERPLASPYARLRARDGGAVVNLRLEAVPMGEPSRLVLQQLDGSRDRAFLIDFLAHWLENYGARHGSGALPAEPANLNDRAARYIDQALDGFARSALLIG